MSPAVLVLLVLAACGDEDADVVVVQSTPIIFASNPPMPGPITVLFDSPFPIAITLRDANVDDNLYVRVFRGASGETEAKPPVAEKSFFNDPMLGTQDRLGWIETMRWCSGATPDEGVVFTVVVADQPFVTDAAVPPAYKAVANQGRSSEGQWVGKCVQTI